MTFRTAADSRTKAAHAMGYHHSCILAVETCSHQRVVPSEGPFRTRLSGTLIWFAGMVLGEPGLRSAWQAASSLPETVAKMLVPCQPQYVPIGSPSGLHMSDNCLPWLDKSFHPRFSHVRLILENGSCQIQFCQSLCDNVDLAWAASMTSAEAISQRAFGVCQCVHKRFRMHAMIILDAAMVAALADKLFRNILSRRLTAQFALPSRCVNTITTHTPFSLLLYGRALWTGKDAAYSSATPAG